MTTTPGKAKQRWQELCELAVNERDPERLVELAAEISRALDERNERRQQRPTED